MQRFVRGATYDISYVPWNHFQLEANPPDSPFWHATLETHIPQFYADNWILTGREITLQSEEAMKNAQAAGAQVGDRGSGNEIKVFMGALWVARQYLACDKDKALNRHTVNLYLTRIVPDMIRRFYKGKDSSGQFKFKDKYRPKIVKKEDKRKRKL